MVFYFHGKVQLQRKSRQFLMRARQWRAKLCAVGMRNAILGNDLNSLFVGCVGSMDNRGSFCQSFARCYHVRCSLNVFPSDTCFKTTSNANRHFIEWKRKTTLTKTPLWIKATIRKKEILLWEHKWGAVAPRHSSSENQKKWAGKIWGCPQYKTNHT